MPRPQRLKIFGSRNWCCLLALLGLGSTPGFCRELRVASYNVWGLPSPLLRHGERFDRIPDAINALDADVVLIQEAFTDKAQALTRLFNFPYFAWGPKSRFLHFSSGLLILSRFPIEETARITYTHCGGVDCFANKGALYAKIRIPRGSKIGTAKGDLQDSKVSVFNTHLNANGHEDVRASQAAHLLRFVRSYSQGLPTVVGGDFNGEGQSVFRKAKQALLLRDAHAEFVWNEPGVSQQARDAFTADPLHNPFLSPSETRRRLDHIFLFDGSSQDKDGNPGRWKVINYGLFFDGVHGDVLSDHFGVRVTAGIPAS